MKRKKKLIKYLSILDQPIRFNPFVFSRTFWLWSLLGVVGGLTAGLYWIVLEFFIHKIDVFTDWQVIPIMTISGLLAGIIIHLIGDPGEIQLIVNNIRFKKGKLNPKNNPSMILSSLLCVGSGGSLGPEAPLVQVTGSTGTWLGKFFRMKGDELRSMSIAGMASGFTALFGAPLGGSLFALEILHYKDSVEYYKAIVPALVASCFSYIIFALIIQVGLGATWDLPSYYYSGISDFGHAILLAFCATIAGWLFIYCTKGLKKLSEWYVVPIYIKTTIGGFLLGLIAFYLPITRYFGHHEINDLLSGNFSLNSLILIFIFKIIAISVTVTSGWRGGFIIPLFFVGATLGLIVHNIFPSVGVPLAIVSCMAGINACVTRTPMSTTILLASLTGFAYFIPILFSSMTGYLLAPRIPFIGSQEAPVKKQ